MLDAAEAGTQPEQIVLAVGQALRRGWIDPSHVRDAAERRGARVADLVNRALAVAQAAPQH